MIINPNYSINETTSTWLQIFRKFLSSRNKATKKEQTKNKEKKIKALGLELHQPKLKKKSFPFSSFFITLGFSLPLFSHPKPFLLLSLNHPKTTTFLCLSFPSPLYSIFCQPP